MSAMIRQPQAKNTYLNITILNETISGFTSPTLKLLLLQCVKIAQSYDPRQSIPKKLTNSITTSRCRKFGN